MKIPKKRDPHSAADRTYNYLIAHKSQILKYITVALMTGIIQFIAGRLLPIPSIGVFTLRLALMFIWLKIWVYPQSGRLWFNIAREAMLAIMLIFLSSFALAYLASWVDLLVRRPALMRYINGVLLEILYFFFYQKVIFKEE